MPNNEKKDKPIVKTIVRPLKIDNSFNKRIDIKGIDVSGAKRHVYHLTRKGTGVAVVDDGIIDHHALIQSEACNAGLQNILRLQIMRYGTIENAIARNADKQVFADVSKIPTSIAEQEVYLKDIQNDVDTLCAKLGISKDELLKANQEFLAKKLAELNNAAAPAAEGDNK